MSLICIIMLPCNTGALQSNFRDPPSDTGALPPMPRQSRGVSGLTVTHRSASGNVPSQTVA